MIYVCRIDGVILFRDTNLDDFARSFKKCYDEMEEAVENGILVEILKFTDEEYSTLMECNY